MRCETPEGVLTWCIAPPDAHSKLFDFDIVESDIEQNEDFTDNGFEEIYKINEKSKDFLITAEELINAYPAQSFIIDSCHSGQMALEVKKRLGDENGSFVFASSLGSNTAVDSDNGGGQLIESLVKMLESKDEDLCKLDFDNDGQISEREAYAGVFLLMHKMQLMI